MLSLLYGSLTLHTLLFCFILLNVVNYVIRARKYRYLHILLFYVNVPCFVTMRIVIIVIQITQATQAARNSDFTVSHRIIFVVNIFSWINLQLFIMLGIQQLCSVVELVHHLNVAIRELGRTTSTIDSRTVSQVNSQLKNCHLQRRIRTSRKVFLLAAILI